MHLLRTDTRTLDDAVEPIEIAQNPAELIVLSFTDSDLALATAAAESWPEEAPSLRVASLQQLRHPFSVDLYLAKVVQGARFVLVRLLGGLEYWRYGAEELARAARRDGFALALVPGDGVADARLAALSTVPPDELARLWRYWENGGLDNARACLDLMAGRSDRAEPIRVRRSGLFRAACRDAERPAAPAATIVFYRSAYLAGDAAPIVALADALAARGFAVRAVFCASLKDPCAATAIACELARHPPDIILNTTAFSARSGERAGVLDRADCPVLQVILSGAEAQAWRESTRGLSATDLAMNVVLPELDGRIVTRAISFKAAALRSERVEFTRVAHRPDAERCGFVAALASAWARLRGTPRAERRIALILSDYPAKSGRSGYAVGLDTPASVVAIAADLRAAGYTVAPLPEAGALIRELQAAPGASLTLAAYRALYAGLPAPFRAMLEARWGEPEHDPGLIEGAFRFPALAAGELVVAFQPGREPAGDDRRGTYHDTGAPPGHRYVAFYLWLRHVLRVDAIVHAGTHGTTEWLPGKAVALSADCAPEVVIGPMPVIYPFIVNNPGEAAQSKRRLAAVTVGHLSPPLVEAGAHGAAAELEGYLDEYAEAQTLDPRRARRLAQVALAKAAESGLAHESGATTASDPQDALARLDAFLCDLKEMRIGDGLHVFARGGSCAEAERHGLLAALDGRFVEPGPGGAPSRGRLDVLPTGRNLFTVDPRAVPTRTAWEIGRRTADEVITRYLQDHGEYPRTIVLDLWGSATMRTGGDDLAQAMALLGVQPTWDDGSTRVVGFAILPGATLGRPRVDVTLRISGLFRDVFPGQIALFDQAVRAVAALNEDDGENPLAAAARALPESERAAGTWRIFGAAPGGYGTGVAAHALGDAWRDRDELGARYLQATSHAYGSAEAAIPAPDRFRTRVANADAFVHVQDMAEGDVLDSDAFAEHEGGFAAAAQSTGAHPALFHVDTTRGERAVVRTLPEEIARVVRARASNPRWIAGQMRHGHRGAAEIAETVDNLFVFAATTDAVDSRHFDLLFDATCGDDTVRAFLLDANPDAARAIAARFAEAARRGFWTSRRNSTAESLAAMMAPATGADAPPLPASGERTSHGSDRGEGLATPVVRAAPHPDGAAHLLDLSPLRGARHADHAA